MRSIIAILIAIITTGCSSRIVCEIQTEDEQIQSIIEKVIHNETQKTFIEKIQENVFEDRVEDSPQEYPEG